MIQVPFSCLVILVALLLPGCGRPQEIVQSNRNTSVEKTAPNPTKEDNVLFEGEYIVFLSSERSNLKKLPLKRGEGKSCLKQVDEKITSKLLELNYNGNMEYFEFDVKEKRKLPGEKFVIQFSKDQFAKIQPNLLLKLDQFFGYMDFRNLYFIENSNVGYLLLIGHQSATSGIGHNYRLHLLIPLDLNKPEISFNSISDDPMRVKVDNSGVVYYAQVDEREDEPFPKIDSKARRLNASLFTFDHTSKKELEFQFICKEINKVLD